MSKSQIASNRMRLLFLAAADSIHSYRWIKYFADRGHHVHWVSLSPQTVGEPLPSVTFHRISQGVTKAGTVLSALRHVRRLIARETFDLVHAHYAGTYGLIAALAATGPFILTAWGSDVLFARKSPIKRPILKYILRRATEITCDAEHMVEAMVELGVEHRKLHLILFGTDTDRFRPLGKNPDVLSRWSNSGQQVIISLRSLYPVYDLPTLLRAIPLVARAVPAIQVIIAGGGTEREMLVALAGELQVGHLVNFCGPIANTELPSILSTADVYVSTSLSDAGLAASTAEAMACGLPVVVTDSGQNRSWVHDGEEGFLVPVTQPAALAEKIIWLLRHPDSARQLGAKGRELIETRNNYHREMAKVESLYAATIA